MLSFEVIVTTDSLPAVDNNGSTVVPAVEAVVVLV